MFKKCLIASTIAVGLIGAIPASAAIVTYSGADNGVGPGDSHPNTDSATALFTAAATHTNLITFEGATLPTVAPGVSVTLVGASGGGLVSTDQHTPTPLGFNTTPGGSEWLQLFPDFNSAVGETATFSFAQPIDAFGANFTDTQVSFPGTITITFSDGASEVLSPVKNDDTGGVLFFGFTDLGKSISSIAINTGSTFETRDIWGIDDVRFETVPEPMTIAVVGAGLLGLGLSRRRR